MSTHASGPALTVDAPWVVAKFGGSSVSSVDSWRRIGEIAAAHRQCGRRVMIVVSALSGVTDMLAELIAIRADVGASAALRARLQKLHQQLLVSLGLPRRNALDGWLARLDALLEDPRAATAPYSWQAEVLALGELLSSTLGAAWLATQQLPVRWLDARGILRSAHVADHGDWANCMNASLQSSADGLAQSLASQGDLFVTQGFVARDADGSSVVLGRGGSDTSAAHFGVRLAATSVELWTDVPGLFSANPRLVPQARLLASLDYEEAQEIATTGAGVLHPRCISPLRVARIPVHIRDTRNPHLPGTRISSAVAATAPCIKAISARKGIVLVSMESIGMWQQVGFLADVFSHFKRHGLSVDLVSSSETNVTVSLAPTENLINSDVLEALCADLAKVCRVKVIAPCAAITLVGRGMRALLHQLSSVLAEFGSLDVHLLSQSSNNLNLTFVVDEGLADALVPQLHAMLMRTDALRAADQTIFGASWQQLMSGAAVTAKPSWWLARRAELLVLAQRGSPCYVYSLEQVRSRARDLRGLRARGHDGVIVDRWHYAIKANSHPQVLRTLVDEGFRLECVSWNEVLAVRAAVPKLQPKQIMFTPNFAPRDEYLLALEAGVRLTLDTLHPLQHWGQEFAGQEIFLRVDPGVGRGHHDKVRTGGEDSKFGLALDQLDAFRELAARHDVRIVGLHAHSGSGIVDAAHWRSVHMQLASLAEQFDRVRILNVGGGLGLPERPGEPALDLQQMIDGLAEVKSAYPQFQLWMEPGRFLVAEAGVLLTRVTQLKRKGDVDYVGVDTGMNSLLRPALYDAWHDIVNLQRLGEPPAGLVQVVGPLCESGDVLGRNRRLPNCKEGDVILIDQAGAYGAVMASHYNLREPAIEVVLS